MKTKKNIRIYGAGGHSLVIKHVLELSGHHVSETFDDKPERIHRAYNSVNSGVRENISEFPHAGDPIIIAIGNNREREEIADFLQCDFESAVHPNAQIAENSSIGEGTVVFAGAIIQPNTVIGKHVIINTSASVDHDNIIGDFAHISPKVALCGHVEVGTGSHVGAGAVVIPEIKIGKWCTIGAGAIVIQDVPDFATVVGNPGKIIKIKSENEL